MSNKDGKHIRMKQRLMSGIMQKSSINGLDETKNVAVVQI